VSDISLIWVERKPEYFCKWDQTGKSPIEPVGQIARGGPEVRAYTLTPGMAKVSSGSKMATRGKKAGNRASAPKRLGLVHKLKSAGLKSGGLKSRRPKSGKPKSGNPKSGTARLKSQLRAARGHQTATSDILRVISQSPTDVQPVFDAIVLSAARLLRCDRAFIQRCEGDSFWTVASSGPKGPLPITQSSNAPIDPDANFPSRAIVAKKTLHLPDWSTIDLPEFERHIREAHGINSALYMPLLREGECIGLLAITGKQANMFGGSEIALAESFRDQALIAIENTRLFNETREALERQTATADILKVIASSPSDVQPVFEAIAGSAKRLIGGFSAAVLRFVDDAAHLAAFTPTNPAADEVLKATFPRPVTELQFFQLTKAGKVVVQVTDTETDLDAQMKDIARARGFRSVLLSPLMNKETPIGLITVTRKDPGSFADHHIQLLQTFADQAVIAIENVRLFNEVQQRTDDLSESLQQQTATAEVLRVISRSAFDLDSVMSTLAHSARELCGTESCALFLRDGDFLVCRGVAAVDYSLADVMRQNPVQIDSHSHMGRAVLTGTIANVADFQKSNTNLLKFHAMIGFNSFLAVPSHAGWPRCGRIHPASESTRRLHRAPGRIGARFR
jgi:two-component system NtrC family sensor kinase